MLFFLRLFSIFRDLEARAAMQSRTQQEFDDLTAEKNSLETDLGNIREAYQELTTEKLLLQDRLDSAIQDKDKLWEEMSNALENERFALRMQINHAVQHAGGGVVYADAHALPAAVVRPIQKGGPVGRSGRLLPSEIKSRINTTVLRQLAERQKEERQKQESGITEISA